jgi:D-aspartate ligase
VESAGAVVVGGHVNGVGLVRALAARGIPTAVVTTQPWDVAHRSRLVVAREALSALDEHPDRLLEALERRASDWRGWAVLPANDEALAALGRDHDRLSRTYRVLSPPAEIADCFLDKTRMLAVAEAVGLDLPRRYGPATAAASTALRFPVLVKPDVSHRFRARFGCKLFAAPDRRALEDAVARLRESGLSGHVFDCVPGSDREIHAYCTYVDAAGEPRGGVTVRKIRQGPPRFGVACVAEIVDDEPVLRDATLAILRRVGFRGIASAEFKRDPRDGRFRFLEVNGRSVIYNGLLRRGGVDLTTLAWADQVCGAPLDATPNGWPGVWVNVHADLLYALAARGDGAPSLRELLATYRRPMVEALWSARDPRPFLAQWLGTARRGIGMLRGR